MPDPIEALIRKAASNRRVLTLGGGLPWPRQFPRRALAQALGEVLHQSPRGSRVFTDQESYPGALDLFRARGVTPVALGGKAKGVKAIYAMPAVGNPRGRAQSRPGRRALLALGLPIIEDDAYGELRFDGRNLRPLAAEAPDQVYYLGTVSKTLAPGLRVGWLVPPERALERALALKRNADLQANGLGQALVERSLAGRGLPRRLADLRRLYATRARRLWRAVRRELPQAVCSFPEGGFALWLEFPGQRVRGGELGLLEAAMRLCFSMLDPPRLEEGAARLARAIRAKMAR